MKKLSLLTATMVLSAGTAFAQMDEEGRVNVNVENVIPEISAGLTTDRGTFPDTVQVPATVAADVCNIDPNALAARLTAGNAYCEALTSSPELARAVEQVMVRGYASDDTPPVSNEETSSVGDNDDPADDATDDGSTDDGGADDGSTDDGGTNGDGSTDGDTDDGTTE